MTNHQFQQEAETTLVREGKKQNKTKNAVFWTLKVLRPIKQTKLRRRSLTYGGPLLTVPSGPLRVEDPHGFVEAAVQLRAVGREAKGVGGRQLIQVVVGSETGAYLPIKGIPHVHGVVAAAAGQTAETVGGQTRKRGKKIKTDQWRGITGV